MRTSLAFCLVFAAMPAAAECYAVNPASGSVSFELKQAGSPFRGAFRRFGGELCLGGARASRIEVWLDPASVDTGLPEIDAALREKEFFAVAEFPRIAFASDSVEERGDNARARGTLDIKGTRREVEVPFSVRVVSGIPTVSGSFVLNRLDYGIGTGEWSNTQWLGAEVRVEFKAILESQRAS